MLGTPFSDQWLSLQRELKKCYYLLETIKQEEPLFNGFHNWQEAITYFRSICWSDPACDAFLLPLFNCFQEGSDPRWHIVMTAIFWHLQISLYQRKTFYDSVNCEELWQIIQWRFIKCAHKLDLSRSKTDITRRFFNMLKESVRFHYKKTQANLLSEAPIEKSVLETINLSRTKESAENAIVQARLSFYLRLELITPVDHELLTGIVNGSESLHEYASRLGLKYDTAKKIRRRALRKITDIENSLSPFCQIPPPYVSVRRKHDRDADDEDNY
jgi:hypothetical protein